MTDFYLFQFYLSSIKSAKLSAPYQQIIKFQFYLSSIKSGARIVAYTIPSWVSILP